MLNITVQSDYGIILITSLLDRKDFTPLSSLIEKTNLPKRYLARIAAELAKNKILESREGKVGGYRLTKQAEKITLFDYLKVFEGDLTITKCSKTDYDCPWEGVCEHKSFFKHQLTSVITSELKKYRLLQILRKKLN